jgi:hypothetical protein
MMHARRQFLKALGVLAAGLVLDEVTGLMVPRRKIWAVGAKLEPEPYRFELTETQTIHLPASSEGSKRLILIDKEGKEFCVATPQADNVEERGPFQRPTAPAQFPEPELVATYGTITLKFNRLVWAVA